MLYVDLSTLRRIELERLLESARERGDAALLQRIEEELIARRARGRSSGEPWANAADPDDAMEDEDELSADAAWGTQPHEQPLRLAREAPRERGGGRWGWVSSAFAVGIALGLGAGWWISGLSRAPEAPAVARAAMALSPTATVPVGPAVSDASAGATPPATPVPETPAAGPPAASPAPTAATPANEPTAEPPLAAAEAPRLSKHCAAEPTAADRAICADPGLRLLQQDLRRAYADALKTHKDRAGLRRRQLAWRSARNGVSDPDRLADLYQRRIRQLGGPTRHGSEPREDRPDHSSD